MKAGFSASVRKRWGVFCVSQDPCNLEATLQIYTVEFWPQEKTVHCTILPYPVQKRSVNVIANHCISGNNSYSTTFEVSIT